MGCKFCIFYKKNENFPNSVYAGWCTFHPEHIPCNELHLCGQFKFKDENTLKEIFNLINSLEVECSDLKYKIHHIHNYEKAYKLKCEEHKKLMRFMRKFFGSRVNELLNSWKEEKLNG